MDLARFQGELTGLLEGIEHPRALAALALGEEAGEVLRCVLDAEGYGKDVSASLAGEVGDVLVALAEVASRYGLALDACAEGALAKLRARAPGWRQELGPRLVDLRRRYDA
jgi:NTP pyrophosphatase (non-canonical NTP hydrolase)